MGNGVVVEEGHNVRRGGSQCGIPRDVEAGTRLDVADRLEFEDLLLVAADLLVRQLGTRLAVSALAEHTRVAVTSGRVRVTARNADGALHRAVEAGSVVFARALSELLYQIEPTDPLTLAAVSAALLLVAGVACFVPARRATLVPPIVALRSS